MAAIQYSDAFQPGYMKQLLETKTFGAVVETMNGGFLASTFGYDEWYRLNTNYAQIFAASDKYHGKPLVGIN